MVSVILIVIGIDDRRSSNHLQSRFECRRNDSYSCSFQFTLIVYIFVVHI